jgi:hypothetical protein
MTPIGQKNRVLVMDSFEIHRRTALAVHATPLNPGVRVAGEVAQLVLAVSARQFGVGSHDPAAWSDDHLGGSKSWPATGIAATADGHDRQRGRVVAVVVLLGGAATVNTREGARPLKLAATDRAGDLQMGLNVGAATGRKPRGNLARVAKVSACAASEHVDAPAFDALEFLKHSGRLSFGLAGTQEDVRVLKLHLRGDSAIEPVLHPLNASLRLVVSKKLRDLGGATKGFDEVFVVHALY